MTKYRGYLITTNPFSPTLYKVATEGRGGRIPADLEGSFTSVGLIKEIVDHYLLAQEASRGKAPTKE
jgi:hypothetical protein